MTVPTCPCGCLMRERPTLTHSLCWACYKCGIWQWGPMDAAVGTSWGVWNAKLVPMPDILLHHLQPSPN